MATERAMNEMNSSEFDVLQLASCQTNDSKTMNDPIGKKDTKTDRQRDRHERFRHRRHHHHHPFQSAITLTHTLTTHTHIRRLQHITLFIFI